MLKGYMACLNKLCCFIHHQSIATHARTPTPTHTYTHTRTHTYTHNGPRYEVRDSKGAIVVARTISEAARKLGLMAAESTGAGNLLSIVQINGKDVAFLHVPCTQPPT
jgi:hypothetical protein